MQVIKRPRVLLVGKTRFSLNPLEVIHVWPPRILAAKEIKERYNYNSFCNLNMVSQQVLDDIQVVLFLGQIEGGFALLCYVECQQSLPMF